MAGILQYAIEGKLVKQDPNDERNFLIYYAIDAIKRIKPKYVLLENVPKQLTTKISVNGKKILIYI